MSERDALPSPAALRMRRPRPGAILGRLCGVGHPGFVAFAAVAPTTPMTVPACSCVVSRQFGGSTYGGTSVSGAGSIFPMTGDVTCGLDSD
jgi:hypothetical protein